MGGREGVERRQRKGREKAGRRWKRGGKRQRNGRETMEKGRKERQRGDRERAEKRWRSGGQTAEKCLRGEREGVEKKDEKPRPRPGFWCAGRGLTNRQ